MVKLPDHTQSEAGENLDSHPLHFGRYTARCTVPAPRDGRCRSLKRLSDQFFALFPERRGILEIKRIPAHSLAGWADDYVIRYSLADVAVLAVLSADLFCRSDDACPDRGCRTLGNGLELEGVMAFRCKLLPYLIDHCLEVGWVHVAGQFGMNASGVDGCSAYALLLMPAVKLDGEQDVCRLRATV